MEILIDVPPSMYPYIEWVLLWAGKLVAFVLGGWDHIGVSWNILTGSLAQLLDIPKNAFVPIFGALFFFWPVILSLMMAVATASTWIFWLLTGVVVGLIQVFFVSYHFFMISADVVGLSFLKTYSMMRHQVLHILDKAGNTRKSKRRVWQQNLAACANYEDYMKIRLQPRDVTPEMSDDGETSENDAALPPASKPMRRSLSFTRRRVSNSKMRRNQSFNDKPSASLTEADPVVRHELGHRLADLVVQTTDRLKQARLSWQVATNSSSANETNLPYLLSGVVKRNHLQLDDSIIDNARNVAACGQYGLTIPTRAVIRDYMQEVEKGLDWIAEAPSAADSLTGTTDDEKSAGTSVQYNELVERLTLVRKMKQNMGRTALMLSGGGAQAMYHIGVIRSLLESKLYADIKVISGTSGGSIIAAMCAVKTPEELYSEICISTVVSDYKKNGEQKTKKIRWFPPLTEMAAYWLKHKLLVDSAYFRRTCEFYYSDTTFEEAFERTGKHVCITVSASRATGSTVQRLLLNHISTPHVTIASAVAASCALPGVMAPAKLLSKNAKGELEPFEVDGVEWIDGSVQADLPFQRISTMFAVSSFLVSQTNFHVLPFLNKEYHPTKKSLYWKLFSTIEWDIRSRALKLSKLGLFPQMFGQDMSKVFEQQYHGNLTIVPRFTTMQTFGLKTLSNPTEADMENYIKYGQIASWPYLNAIRELMRLEKALDECLHRLEDRVRDLNEDWLLENDDIESIASSSAAAHPHRGVRIIGRPPSYGMRSSSGISVESERFKQLEQENKRLQKELDQLREQMHSQTEPSTPVSRNVLTSLLGISPKSSTDSEMPGNPTMPKNVDNDSTVESMSRATLAPRTSNDNSSILRDKSTTLSTNNGSKSTAVGGESEGKVWNMIKTSTAQLSSVKAASPAREKACLVLDKSAKTHREKRTNSKVEDAKELSEIEKARLYASTLLADADESEKPGIGSWFVKQKEKIQHLVDGGDD